MNYLFSHYFGPATMKPIDYIRTFPTLPYKLYSMKLSLWHKVDPELPSSPEKDSFKTPVMISEQECYDRYMDPDKHGSVDYYLYTYHETLAKVAIRQRQLDVVRLWIAYSVNIDLFIMASDDLRDNIKTSLAEKRDEDKEEEDCEVFVRLIVRINGIVCIGWSVREPQADAT
ncbi:hypothetical protein E4U39_007480 [Claviceps sp. Clav50 group G5]|nr:hypothetical protein E4U39_007480 [Claviceps sp. Clav50 group G5]